MATQDSLPGLRLLGCRCTLPLESFGGLLVAGLRPERRECGRYSALALSRSVEGIRLECRASVSRLMELNISTRSVSRILKER